MSYNHYKTTEVRDLAWALFSPTVLHSDQLAEKSQQINNCGLTLTPSRQNWLEKLDGEPAPLHEHLNTLHSSRLGLYFESLWHFFLQEDPGVNLIAHNLPIRQQGRTLGEFDCLYYCFKRERYFHLELAVKYYLSCRNTTIGHGPSHWKEWLGPTNTDHLDRKINHLTQHQIQLGNNPAAQDALNELGIDNLAKEIEIKGYLFQSLSDPLPAPYAHNDENRLCRWLPIAELAQYLEKSSEQLFSVLPKTLWLAPTTLKNKSVEARKAPSLVALLFEHLSNRGRPALIAAFDPAGYECQRFFVVGDSWPNNSGQPGKPPAAL